ncbi:MAG: Verru_Chthon cassette protein A [Verrucomicrobiota bacterium]
MNTRHPRLLSHALFPLPSKGRRGAALVIVLSFIVILTVLTIAFLSSVSTEFKSSVAQSNSLSVRQLADSTVQYVIGQIRLASSGSTTQTWASQPGMIRTYGDDGNARQAFKLYSSGRSVETITGNSFNPSVDLPDATWSAKNALWTDLNAPANDASGTPVFPIIDPRAAAIVSGSYSVVDGFAYDTTIVTGSNTRPSSSTDTSARLPMPVRWIYVLKDGQFAIPSSNGSGTTADFSSSTPKPTVQNPIVGRVAFWTDDETCKLNVNTASGGVPWEPPAFASPIEMAFSRFRPLKSEYSRSPGHPATTSLLPVFWSLAGLDSPNQNLFPSIDTASVLTALNNFSPLGPAVGLDTSKIWSPAAFNNNSIFYTGSNTGLIPFSPRLGWGWSQMGTQPTVVLLSGSVQNSTGTFNAYRLYSSVDEALYGGNATTSNPRPANAFKMTSSQVELTKFFLTTNSRAPETNPLNQPKVAIWPVPDASNGPVANSVKSSTLGYRSSFDKLVAFCSGIGTADAKGNPKYPFFFSRYDSTSPTNDVAGRNQDVLNYLSRSLRVRVPGFGADLQSAMQTRYPGSNQASDRILTLIFDYIRSCINLLDPSAGAPGTPAGSSPSTYLQFAYTNPITATGGQGQVIPASVTLNGQNYKGLGRLPVIKSVNITFIATATNQPPLYVDNSGAPVKNAAGNYQINPMHPFTLTPPAVPTVTGAAPALVLNTMVSGSTYYPFFKYDTTAKQYDLTQTHPGLRFMPTINPKTGRFDVVNPAQVAAASSLNYHETQIKAAIYPELFQLSPGPVGNSAAFRVQLVSVSGFAISSAAGTAPGGTLNFTPGYETRQGISQDYTYSSINMQANPPYRSTNTVVVGGDATNGGGSTFNMGPGTVVFNILPLTGTTGIQKYTVTFPAATLPTPKLGFDSSRSDVFTNTALYLDINNNNLNQAERGSTTDGCLKMTAATTRSMELLYGDPRTIAALPDVPSSYFVPHRDYFDYGIPTNPIISNGGTPPIRTAHAIGSAPYGFTTNDAWWFYRGATLGMLSDAVSFAPPKTSPFDPLNGNLSTYKGLLAAKFPLFSGGGGTLGLGTPATAPDKIRRLAYNATAGNYVNNWVNNAGVDSPMAASFPPLTSTVEFRSDATGYNPGANSAYRFDSDADNFRTKIWPKGGDFDNPAIGFCFPDGPFIGKVSETNCGSLMKASGWCFYPDCIDGYTPDVGVYFSPCRLAPSPVIFGSLPVGNSPDLSWQTLMFSPNPNASTSNLRDARTGNVGIPEAGTVPAAGKAPDFLLLDYFWSPVVEPYAISEAFSTAGKVNMNYQIAPFTYITRNTALRGVLRDTLLTAVQDRQMSYYKSVYIPNNSSFQNDLKNTGGWMYRYPTHAGETLKQFDQRFSNGDIFRSASEICSLWLYPAQQPSSPGSNSPNTPLVNWDSASSGIKSWWYDDPANARKSLTGDNMRERPYATLYPRLTTKSNTYTVYFKVQMLKKVPTSAVDQWVEGKDQVVSEFRGSSAVERYIDASDPNLNLIDFADPNSAAVKSLDDYYRFRVINTKRFAP